MGECRYAADVAWTAASVSHRTRRESKKGRETTEIAYAISSLTAERAGAEKLLSYNRGHWGIENRLHWVRDVSLGEDACRANVGHSPQNLAAFRNVSLLLSRLSGVNEILSTLRDFATKPYELLKFLRIMKQ